MRSVSDILNEASRLPNFNEKFDYLMSKSDQAIIFGSYAAGVQHKESDIDILFITREKSIKTRFLDFVCVPPNRTKLKSWLGTELANHIKVYGIWIKGDDSWKYETFISKNALNRKKLLIIHRLTHLWLKKASISDVSMRRLFKDVLLDSYRLVHMSEGLPVPANRILVDRFVQENRNIVFEITKPEYLGSIGQAFLHEIFDLFNSELLNEQLKDLLKAVTDEKTKF